MNELTTTKTHLLELPADAKAAALTIGHLADRAAAVTAFSDYQETKAAATLSAQKRDLKRFTSFLNDIYGRGGIDLQFLPDQLYSHPAAWAVITAGLVKLYKKSLQDAGLTIATINRSLSTIKRYAALATEAGQMPTEQNALIRLVKSISAKEGINLDEKREAEGTGTRASSKKATAVAVDGQIIAELKAMQPDTPAGKRDALIMCLLFDHGLRASEIAGLKMGSVNMESGQITVYRKKTKTTDLLNMTPDTRAAMAAYLPHNLHFADHALVLASTKPGKNNTGGRLKGNGIHRVDVSRILNRHGKKLAEKYGVKSLEKLSAHDGRHQWATDALEGGSSVAAVQQAGGWASPAMPLRYANKNKVANEGLILKR